MRNLVWFRNDLRVYDNPALDAACNDNNEVVAVYIVSESQWDEHNDSVNKISFWFRCLVELEKELKKIPFFVRGKARKNTEKYAENNGFSEISIETLYEAKAHYAN